MAASDTRGVRGIPAATFETRALSMSEPICFGVNRLELLAARTASGVDGTLARAIADCELHGPVRIAQISAQTMGQGPLACTHFVAVISASLEVLDLLPTQNLDGGHLLAIGLQRAKQRPPPLLISRILIVAGITLIVYLMLLVILWDLLCRDLSRLRIPEEQSALPSLQPVPALVAMPLSLRHKAPKFSGWCLCRVLVLALMHNFLRGPSVLAISNHRCPMSFPDIFGSAPALL